MMQHEYLISVYTYLYTYITPHLYLVNAVKCWATDPPSPPSVTSKRLFQADANLGVYPAELSELRESFGESQDGYVTLAEGF